MKNDEITVMNLSEFFECMNPETSVAIEWNGEEIFSSKVCDISEDESVMYWIKAESIVLKDGIMYIPVEHHDEINMQLEEKRSSTCIENVENRADNISERIRNLEAIVWAQEHYAQLMYISEKSEDKTDFKNQLMKQFCFDANQAQAITDMRSSIFTLQERKRVREELWQLLSKEIY